MPQFDPSSFFSQVIWLLISFSILYFIMVRFIVPRLEIIEDQRKNRIEADQKRAQYLIAEATAIENYCKEQRAAALQQAAQRLADARTQIQKDTHIKDQEIEKKLLLLTAKSNKKIAQIKQNAEVELRPIIINLINNLLTHYGIKHISEEELSLYLQKWPLVKTHIYTDI